MIRIRVVARPGKTSIECTGHGSDKVCAGISAIMVTAQLGLSLIAHEYPRSAKLVVGKK